MILTTLPKDTGLIRLKNSSDFAECQAGVRLKGKKMAEKTVFLRAEKTLKPIISVEIITIFYM